MSQPISNSGVNEMRATVVVPPYDRERSECWEGDFASQFPVNTQGQPDGMATLCVNTPHEGFRIEAQIVNGNMQGKASVYSNTNILVAEVTFEAGIANGPCKLFDTTGKLFFEGNLKSGYRSGRGKEYDREGRVLYDGYFKMGKRMNLIPSYEMRGYWKEYAEDGTLLSVSEINKDTGEKEGISIEYTEGTLGKIYQIKDGQETDYEGIFKFYCESKKVWYEGNIERGIVHGYGEMYDTEGKYIFKGLFDCGRKLTIKKMSGSGGYQKEYDCEEHLVNICKRDKNNKFEGVCYHYDLKGKISEIIEWSEGNIVALLATFEDGKMSEFQNDVKQYEGDYYEVSDFEYLRDGFGQEFDSDGETVIYEGYYFRGKRHGFGKTYQDGEVVYDGLWISGKTKNQYYIRYFIIAIVIIAVLVSLPFIFLALNLEIVAAIDFYATILFFFYGLKAYCCSIKGYFDLFIASILHKGTLKIKDFQFKDDDVFVAPRFTKKIDIRDFCFQEGTTFRVVGLHRLKSLKVGSSSFYDLGDGKKRKEDRYEFKISNCMQLESIDIGKISFLDFECDIIIKKLPSLRLLKIGDIGSDVGNLIGCSLELKG